MNELLIGIGFDPLVVSAILGPLLSVAYAAVDIPSWSPTKRRVIVLIAAAVLTIGVWAAGAYPWAWEYLVSVWAVIIASAQTAFTILKRIGVIDWIGRVTPGGEGYAPRHAETGEDQ
ncbi:hypothetical protein [Schaalia hyovaginalis]|uniref:Uncharacterized protein n=1 Tax=Schaalia hyovaginalis TaxID=29316 RepID=A0A923E3C0_9ACTO|nr:hypothetical protein [Schaalia hyovaginalis]MBB6333627.1 hypothetical protein [Schaalia hyovaginalis]MDY2669760.1 hypothetical protein [Schaalia hyovaginalis]